MALIERIERDVAPLEVVVFNIGANVRFAVTETTERVYRKVWEMAALAGFLVGREAARSTSPLLEWMRRYGRYLSPTGARDMGVAVATYLRASVAIHAECLLLCLPFVLAVLLPHLVLQGMSDFDPALWQVWRTPWWPIAILVLVLCVPGLMAAYWIARENPESEPGARSALRD